MCSAPPSAAVNTLRAGRSLFVGTVRVLQRDLPVVLAVHDEEGHSDLFDDALEVHPIGEVEEFVEVVVAPYPHDVSPVVRYRPFARTFDTPSLDRAPVVVGTPRDTQSEALFERGDVVVRAVTELGLPVKT